MPAKRRRNRSRRKKQTESNTEAVTSHHRRGRPTDSKDTDLSTNADTQQTSATADCGGCHRRDPSAVKRSCHRDICEPCLPPDESPLKSPSCLESLLASTVKNFNIGKVKNLWMSARDGKEADTTACNCSVHVQKSLQFLCLECDEQVCSLCKMAEHEGHRTKTLSIVAAEAEERVLQARDNRLLELQARLQRAVRETKERREALSHMQQDAEDSIRKRHAQLLHIIDEYRDSALLELEAMAAEADADFQADEDRLGVELNVLNDLLKRLERSVTDTDPSDVLMMDRKIESEWSSDEIAVRRSKALPSHTYKLEHKYASDETVNGRVFVYIEGVQQLNDRISHIIGHTEVTKTALPKFSLNMKITPAFRCCEDPEAYLLSVCPIGPEKLSVSYTTSKDFKKGITESFYFDGRPSKSFEFGLCTLCSAGNSVFYPAPYSSINTKLFTTPVAGRFMWPKLASGISTSGLLYIPDYGWRLNPYIRHWLLSPFRFLSLVCSRPFVEAICPLAFDVAKNGEVLAVVDVKDTTCSPLDNNLDKTERVVKLLVYSMEKQYVVTARYEPPTTDFVPTDVCFFSLQGETVLLVSDMGTNSIHVVSLKPSLTSWPDYDFTCKFERFLVADCDDMKQPTALNKDDQGRLWVACKGGQLLVVEPLTSE